MVQRIDVREGQRYAQRLTVRERASVWKVGAIVATGPNVATGSNVATGPKIPHARLINVADPLQTKTISCFALRELMYYELIAEANTGTS
jgi:hypothetical protein